MDRTRVKLTVYFEAPFWVGFFERISDEQISVCKVTFGAEPRDYEILEYLSDKYYSLRFSPANDVVVKKTADNPKRRQRNARKEMRQSGIGTKSQQLISMQRELDKMERNQNNRLQREIEMQRRFEQKQHKKREKHKGH